MLILILGLMIGAFATFLVLRVKFPRTKIDDYQFDTHDFFNVISVAFGLGCIGIIVAICCIAPKVATESIFDDKIVMYQEENALIEQDVDRIVKEYLQHEQNTYKDLKTEESAITLITLFPKLKSDSLVQEQLGIYVKNNAIIKNLKAQL